MLGSYIVVRGANRSTEMQSRGAENRAQKTQYNLPQGIWDNGWEDGLILCLWHGQVGRNEPKLAGRKREQGMVYNLLLLGVHGGKL